MGKPINFKSIESKWQRKWQEKKVFSVNENKKNKYYVLEMFPYPSATGLHMGHSLNFTIGDISARFRRMNGFNVLHPMGFDALGLPAENAAIKAKQHPQKYTKKATTYFTKQMKKLGFSYDWNRKIETTEPGYYKWDQWIFLKMLEKKIAYRKKAPVNWCSKCETVLANEQVVSGKCWRHEDTDVEIKHLEQWFFKITDYADELYDEIDNLDWPSRTKAMQKNWIGKSYGTEIEFEIDEHKWPIFTTRPDTLFGVTFMVISAQHPRLMELVTNEQKSSIEEFLKKIKTVSQKSMKEVEELEKQGVFTGSYAINPANGEKIPVWAGNFVIADYGSGMVMGVPAHDQRDFEFAKKYNIPIKQVISGKIEKDRAYTGKGKLMNSGEFNRLNNDEAKAKIRVWLSKKGKARKTIQFKLKDWLISRQRYWGTPIPVIYCDKCGIVPVPEKDLPIKLPEKVKFGKGNPLITNLKFVNTKCPKCKGKARRETDTMDTFVNSSWYFLRYCDSKNKKKIFDSKKANYWCPIDQYIGGKEHACMHLIYFRFYTKFLRDLGLINFGEPAKKLFHQGVLHGKDGRKMSKSFGNVIDPLMIIEKYSADSLRLALMSFASPDSDTNWDEKVLTGSYKFLKKVYEFVDNCKIGKSDSKTESKINRAIEQITIDIENFKYNLAIIKIRNLFSFLPRETSKDVIEKFLKLLHPFCPYITEELWNKLGNKSFISLEKWPEFDEKKIDKNFEKQEQIVNKLITDINHVLKIVGKKKKIFIYVIPNEKQIFLDNLNLIKKKTGLDVTIYSVNDKDKHDPESKSKKAKSGKPGIYLE